MALENHLESTESLPQSIQSTLVVADKNIMPERPQEFRGYITYRIDKAQHITPTNYLVKSK